jgi:prepilin-type N-terminal cleavage/methylation domain-containing protein
MNLSFTERSRRGFTLLELLVALAVTALLAGLAFSVSTGFFASWTRTSSRQGMEERARLILDQVASDLQAAVRREDGAVWFAATVLDRSDNSGLWELGGRQKPAGQLQLMSSHIDELRFGQAGIWLRFFTSVRGENDVSSADATAQTLSAPVAVAYQLIRHDVTPGTPATPRYCLHRSAVRSAAASGRAGTLEAGYDLEPSQPLYAIPSASNDGSQIGDPAAVRRPAASDTLLAEHVVDFGVRLLVRNAGGEWAAIFPEATGLTEHLGRSSASDAAAGTRYPEAVDVMVRVLSDDGARLLAAMESRQIDSRPREYESDAAWWWGIVEAHSRVFSQRVEILARVP